jgi:periplasmic divalent cation tolerance protein
MSNILLTFCTCPNQEAADRLSHALVDDRLAACVTQIPGLTSVYAWDGETTRDSEILLLIKTTESSFDAMSARLRELHPYDLPEIIATPVTRGLPDYLQWVTTCTDDT